MKRVMAIFILLALASSASAIEIYTATETVAPVYLNTVDTFGVSITPDSFQVMVRFQTDSATASGYRASGIRPDWILREQGFGNPADGDSTFWFFDTAGNIDGGHGDGFYSGVVLAWAQGTSFPTTFRFGLSGNNTNTVYDLVAGDSSGAARHRALLALPSAAPAGSEGLPLVDPSSTDGHIYILAPSGVGLPVCYLGTAGVSSISSTSFATGAITASALATDAAQEIAHYTADSSWLDPVRPRAITELDEDNTTIDLNATAVGSVAGSVGSVGSGGITTGSFAANAIDDAAIADGAIDWGGELDTTGFGQHIDSAKVSRILGRKVWGIAAGSGSDSTTYAQRITPADSAKTSRLIGRKVWGQSGGSSGSDSVAVAQRTVGGVGTITGNVNGSVASVTAGVNLKGDSLNRALVAAESTMTAITATNKANFKADVSGLSTFDNTTDQVIVGTNNDKTGYALTAAERGSIEDSIHANAADYQAGGFAVAGDAMTLTPAERGHIEDSVHANSADYKADVSGLSTFNPTTDSVIIDRSVAEAWLLGLMRTVDGDSNASFRVRVIDSLNVILDSLFNQVWASTGGTVAIDTAQLNRNFRLVLEDSLNVARNATAASYRATGFSTHSATDVKALFGDSIHTLVNYGAPPTVTAISDGVWNEDTTGHYNPGTYGYEAAQSGSGSSPWTSAQRDSLLRSIGWSTDNSIARLNDLASIGCGGTASKPVTIVSLDTSGTDTPVPYMRITVTTLAGGLIGGAQVTDASGTTSWSLDPSTSYIVLTSGAGYAWKNPDTITTAAGVGSETDTISGYNVPTSTPASGSNICAITGNLKDGAGQPIQGAIVNLKMTVPVPVVVVYDTATGELISRDAPTDTTDANGDWTLYRKYSSYLAPNVTYEYVATKGNDIVSGQKATITVPAQATAELKDLLD